MSKFLGTGVALVTPFREDLSVDVEALANIVNHVIEGGVEYLVVLGTTAESATLTQEEKQVVKKTVATANKGRVPMVVGVGGNNTAAIVEELQTTDLSAFDAILSVSPYYNKPTQEGIYQHFKAIAQVSPLPIILYNVPGRTGSNVLPKTIIRLAKDFKNIIGVKEAAGDIVQAMRLIKDKPKDFLVISGDDMITLPMVLVGGAGVISVIGQGFPKKFSSMVRYALRGNLDDANHLHFQLMDIIDYIFEEGNPAGIKAVFESLGLCSGNVRLPLVPASNGLKEKISSFAALEVNKING
ncbi:4-hydroxy-tetrahydrodipicolinate synthase [Galbibacter pacificus]|uniref:4-hydroxy-tetrahydrodipicolinate synthase n=1 Tax=Galbibacter pacificus TaxID=2996052 RepID=A0ABT6FRW7_9FLAO|nr:4-hydroxy-tetrahydrodipicolinate synthase [Galbibacter pacificus]MDG3581680.1 4-hydroxy-tetrahydrodipicolinate synthase [Galbibacter pacificus]MDG3585846.1 4-hydroxy-tetrahydrodipicolinate synthase [Galbibacter pacificus]